MGLIPQLIIPFALLAGAALAQVVITPDRAPVLSKGESLRLTANRPVIWSLAPGSKGTIDSEGTYHATEVVMAKQQTGGCQLLPNDHIFNTRTDLLPVHEKSAEWLAGIKAAAPQARVNYLFSMPINYVSDVTPRTIHTFLYTSLMNGEYWLPTLPQAKYQTGAYIGQGSDQHVFSLNPRTCDFEEVYGPYTDRPAQCPACTAASGTKFNTNQYELLQKGGTDAAGTPIYPGTLRIDEIEHAIATGGGINHLLRVTLTNRFLARANIWPAMANAYAPWGQIPYGAIIRLKSSFTSQSSNPVTQLLVRQLKEYGMIVSDGGTDLQIALDDNVQVPPLVVSAFSEMASSAMVRLDDLEIVDQSSLMESRTSGAVKIGNPHIIPDDYAMVIATDASNPEVQQTLRISLRAATVGFALTKEFIQAGSAPKQLEAVVNGAEDPSLQWTMSPEVPGAALSETGLFTPPATLDEPAITVVRAALTANPAVFEEVTIALLPHGTLRLAAGAQNHIDPEGNKWWSSATLNGVKQWVNGIDSGHNYTCCSAPAFPNSGLYKDGHFSYGDFRARFTVPNGDYKVTAKIYETQRCSPRPCTQHLEVNGKIVHRDVNLVERAGGVEVPLDLEMPVTVTDGTLLVAIRGRQPMGYHSKLSGLKIERVDAQPELRIEPSVVPTLMPGRQHQMYAVGWFLPDDVNWEIVDGPGTLSPNGLYTAPLKPVDGTVQIRATSTTDPEKKAETTISLRRGTMAITPAPKRVNRTGNQQFSATLEGVPYGDVNWSVEGAGTISTAGFYTAPDDVDNDTEVTVTAESMDHPDMRARLQFTVPQSPEAIRINAGGKSCGSEFTDSQGRLWKTDYGYSANTKDYSVGNPAIAGAPADLQKIYWCSRYTGGTDDFEYNFPVPNGRYDVKLMWAEYRASDPGWKFDVLINGDKVLDDFNFINAAGGVRTAYDLTFPVTVNNRNLQIVFDGQPGANYAHGAAINGIEIVPVGREQGSSELKGKVRLSGKTEIR